MEEEFALWYASYSTKNQYLYQNSPSNNTYSYKNSNQDAIVFGTHNQNHETQGIQQSTTTFSYIQLCQRSQLSSNHASKKKSTVNVLNNLLA